MRDSGKITVDESGKITDLASAMIRITDLLKVADVFQASTDVSDTTLSFRVFNDSKKLAALRAGSDITVGRYNTACRWFSENWPEGLDWPTGVTRPVEEATP